MSFLAPLFLFGALAIGLPIVFHLVRRSAKEQMPFSSLMFLHPALPRMTQRNRLEHILLLLLRCLVIGLLALGFARPFFKKSMPVKQSANTGQKIILLLDTSASMRREGLWPAALAKAGDILMKTTAADQAAVFTFDRQAHSFLSFNQWSMLGPAERGTLAAQRLMELKPGWGSTHLGNALITATEAFAEVDKQSQNGAPRRLVVISDLQEGSRLEGLQGYDWPRGLEVQLEKVQAKRPTNAGLQWVIDTEESAEVRTNNSPRIRVSNSANAKREQFQLHWEGMAGVAPLDVYVPPGQSRIVQAPVLPANAVGERLVLTGDDDEFDNTVYVVPPKAELINVVYFGNEAERDPAQPLYYLGRAFQQTRRQSVQLKAYPVSAPLPLGTLDKVRLLIVADGLPESQARAVQQFVELGGTVLWLLKNIEAAESLGRFTGASGLAAEEVKTRNYLMLGQIDFEHPLFAPFADPRYNDFTKIHFWKYRRLATQQLPHVRMLAQFDNGDAALVEIPKGKGRVLALTSSWQPNDSQLALSSKFVPLLYALLELGGGIPAPGIQYRVGDELNLAGLVGSTNAPAITVRKPDGRLVQLGSGVTQFAQTDMPGIYTITSAEPPVRIAVNLEGAESRTALLPIDELERLGVPLKPRAIEVTQQLELKRRLQNAELENQQKLWRWLTMSALVLLLIETALAGWLTRRPAAQSESNV